ncbi:MAG: glycosyltransferase family 4 protein [Planctomycetota bacterium]
MKLAFCLFKFFPYGGLGRDLVRIARACRARGHEVQIYAMHWEGSEDSEFSVQVLPASGWTIGRRCASFVHSLQRELSSRRFDAVVGFNRMPGLDIYYAADFCHARELDDRKLHWLRHTCRNRLYRSYENAVFSRSSNTEVLLISEEEKAVFQEYYDTPDSRFHLLPPGVSRDRIRPANHSETRDRVRSEFGLADEDLSLLLVGSNFRTKGLDRAIRALAALPEETRSRTRLFVIGKDRVQPWERMARRLGILDRVDFLGLRTDVLDFMLAADLLIHPACRENTGTVLLEALVAGLPVVSTDTCGYHGYITESGAGRIIRSPFEQENLDRVLSHMLTSGLLEHWSAQAIAFSQSADIFSLADRAVESIEEIVGIPTPQQEIAS